MSSWKLILIGTANIRYIILTKKKYDRFDKINSSLYIFLLLPPTGVDQCQKQHKYFNLLSKAIEREGSRRTQRGWNDETKLQKLQFPTISRLRSFLVGF